MKKAKDFKMPTAAYCPPDVQSMSFVTERGFTYSSERVTYDEEEDF